MTVDATESARTARDYLAAAAREAGEIAIKFFRPGASTSAEVQRKAGGSPVTEADLAANAFLKAKLAAAFPEAGWLSEETADDPERLGRRFLIVVDPIDGTRAFMDGDPRWAVSAALIADGRPVAGVVHAAALGETYMAAQGEGAHLNGTALAVSKAPLGGPLRAAGPRLILQAMGARLGAALDIAPRVPSLAYRLCMTARGTIDFAVAGENSHDWDIAAADILLQEAGARLLDAAGKTLVYNTRNVRRAALLGAPRALAPSLLAAFGGATGAQAD